MVRDMPDPNGMNHRVVTVKDSKNAPTVETPFLGFPLERGGSSAIITQPDDETGAILCQIQSGRPFLLCKPESFGTIDLWASASNNLIR
ncbi:MAG: hypothetical protein JWR69_275 [Pedosphaera sp.]|nr:hypothetical protein [Pedosphaera sp.]